MISPEHTATPVTVLTGFLGSGKTTLLNRILTGGHGIRFGVLVNDFGSVNIDSRLVASLDGQTIDLSNGCVCCSMQGDLVTSVRRMLSRPRAPEHIVVEASGISDPLGIVSAFRTPVLRDAVRLDGVLAVVDAENARNPRFDRQIVEDQIRASDVVLLSKVDLVERGRRDELHVWLRDLVPDARIVEMVYGDVPLDLLVGMQTEERLSMATSASPAAHNYATWTYETCEPLAYRRVRSALESVDERIVRIKGLLYLADAPNQKFAAHRVGRRTSIDVIGAWTEEQPSSSLVLLGEPGSLTVDEVTSLFDACITRSIALLQPQNLARLKRRVSGPPRADVAGRLRA